MEQSYDPATEALNDDLRIVGRPTTLREQVTSKLRHAITTFRFKPGERLVERSLCEMLGVSRTSVREALRHLESEGLVENIPHRGPIVAIVTAEQAKHLYQLRGAIEGLAARLFAELADDAAIAELRGALADVSDAFDLADPERTLAAVNRFYDVLLKGCRNPLIESTLKSLHGRIVYLRALTTKRADRTRASMAELKAILEAVEARNPLAAEQACRDHADRACQAAIDEIRTDLPAAAGERGGPA